ncbi:MAG: hypothetical protein NTU73_10625 [Ignavibacteriae bacterium]|nr:hypothetical protein [Ignavibacteriota bacterium]
MEEQIINETAPKKKIDKVSVTFWVVAIILTAVSILYQNTTGPTYPKKGNIFFMGNQIDYKLERSWLINTDCPVKINTRDSLIKGFLIWKRYNTSDNETRVPMSFENGYLIGKLEKQEKTAAKLQYYIQLSMGQPGTQNEKLAYIPERKDNEKQEVINIRFRGDVPFMIIILHIIFIFAFELISLKTGMEFFRKEPKYKKYTFWTIGLAVVGGLILGPLVQYYAFGEYWTGFPFGFDLTDNKMIIAFVAWVVALFAIYKSKKPGYWILGAAIITIGIFLIPHSVLSGNVPK